jgi:uncharacterized protein with HEPN domain
LRSDRERLLDILDAIDRIEYQATRDRAAFDRDELAQTAIIRWIEIIGEATRGGSRPTSARRIPKCRGGARPGRGRC